MKYFLIGKTLGHSLSPEIHKELGIDYGLVELPEESDVESLLKYKQFSGINVTIPYKQTVLPYLDFVDNTAREIGAVNTIVNKNGKLCGYNTDICGMDFAIAQAGIFLENKNVLVLGSGGTSKMASCLCKMKNAKSVAIVSRSGKVNYENCYDLQNTEIIINTTPVGMFPNVDKSPIDIEKFEKLESVFDAIYNPLHTKLLLDAKNLKLKFANGLPMLVEQARVAEEKFLDTKIPIEKSIEITKKIKNDMQNIVFVGMSGCGKSTVGKILSKKIGKQFIDTDKEIEKAEGDTIPNIFSKFGEKYFREKEAKIVEKFAKQKGIIIATGGGAVCNKKSAEQLSQNGKIFFLVRDIEKLSRRGRPLAKDLETVKKLFNERLPIYKSVADIEILNNDTLDCAVDKIMEKI